ncbi:MAG: sigma-70 family RNA polymerase sigma factor [Phormidesmis sp.]
MSSVHSGSAKAQSLDLLAQHQKEPSVQLRNRIAGINIGLVHRQAHALIHTSGETFDDLVQVGSMGLLKAIERFDVTKGYAFSTFAVSYIRGEIKHYLRDNSTTVRIPRRWQTLLSHSAKVIRQLHKDLHRWPSEQEIADALEIFVEEWQQVRIASSNRNLLSLDAPITKSETETSSLGELLPDARYHHFQIVQNERMQLQQALAQLEQRTREIVELVYIRDFSRKEIAKRLGLSPSTVSHKLTRGLVQLRIAMRAT